MIVTRDLSPEVKLKPGSEVLAINGVAATDILAGLMTIARPTAPTTPRGSPTSRSGGPASMRPSTSSCRCSSRRSASGWSCSCASPLRRPRSRSGRRPGHGAAQGPREANKERGGASPSRSALESLDERTAYCACRAGRLYNSKWDWRAFLERGIDDLVERRVPGLILDLRGTRGAWTSAIRSSPGSRAKAVRSDRYRRYTRTGPGPCRSRSTPTWTRGTRRSRTGAGRPGRIATASSA